MPGHGRDFPRPKRPETKRIILAKNTPSNITTQTQDDTPKILLKPRERQPPAAPPVSIAAREKTAEEKPEQKENEIESATPMETAVELLCPKLTLNTENLLHFMEPLSGNSNFLVVAAVGTHNVGKSTLLNLLINRSMDVAKMRSKDCEIFETRRGSISLKPITESLNMFVSKDRTFFLDCPPMISNYNFKEYILSELDDLKILILLMSVVHVLIIVQEGAVNPSAVRLIQCAEMMRMNLMEESEEHYPKVIFVQNKCGKAELTLDRRNQMQKLYGDMFKQSKLNHTSVLAKGVNYIAFPDLSKFKLDNFSDRQYIKDEIANLRLQVLSSPRFPLCSTPISEKQWLHLVNKVWDSHGANYFLKKYTGLRDKYNLHNHVAINTATMPENKERSGGGGGSYYLD